MERRGRDDLQRKWVERILARFCSVFLEGFPGKCDGLGGIRGRNADAEQASGVAVCESGLAYAKGQYSISKLEIDLSRYHWWLGLSVNVAWLG